MAIHFTISRRATLQSEKSAAREVLVPRLQSAQPCNVVDYIDNSLWPSKLNGGDLAHSLAEIQSIMLHELADGSPVTLPGIGTFQVSIKGKIDTDKNGGVMGCDVHVEGLRFTPDKGLMKKVRAMQVEQHPDASLIIADKEETERILCELFTHKQTIQHRDVMLAFERTLSTHRTTTLLQQLVAEGRLILEGSGSQTRYRAAEGEFTAPPPTAEGGSTTPATDATEDGSTTPTTSGSEQATAPTTETP